MRQTQQQKHDYAAQMQNMIEEHNPRFFVNFIFNDERAKRIALDRLTGAFAHLNRKIAGPRWYKKPMESLLHGALVFEHLESNPHVHGLLNAPPYVCEDELKKLASDVWQKLVPSGDVVIYEISENDVGACGWYNLKERFNGDFDLQVIWTNMLGEVCLQ